VQPKLWVAHPISVFRVNRFCPNPWVDVIYDHNFLRFLPIFGEKISAFLKNQFYDQIFAKIAIVSAKNANIFENIFQIITLVPDNILLKQGL
jgi:hypothetical protein